MLLPAAGWLVAHMCSLLDIPPAGHPSSCCCSWWCLCVGSRLLQQRTCAGAGFLGAPLPGLAFPVFGFLLAILLLYPVFTLVPQLSYAAAEDPWWLQAPPGPHSILALQHKPATRASLLTLVMLTSHCLSLCMGMRSARDAPASNACAVWGCSAAAAGVH